MHYKVWIEVEEIDEDNDHYESCVEPMDVGWFDTEDAALLFSGRLEEMANILYHPHTHEENQQ